MDTVNTMSTSDLRNTPRRTGRTEKTEGTGRNERTRRSGRGSVLTVVILLLAFVAAVGSKSFLGACIHDDGSFGPCHWAAQALFGTALLIAAQSITLLCMKDAATRRGLFLAMLLTSLLGILIPGPLISLCGMATMRCRALMKPAQTILFTVMGIGSLTGMLMSRGER